MKTFSGRPASQNPDELAAFIALLRARGVRRFLEIGSRHGDTLHEIALHLPKGSKVLGVDLPGALWGQTKSKPALSAAVMDLKTRGYEADFVLGDSRSREVRDYVREAGPFDAVLIDGDHTLEGVRADFEAYGNMAPLVAFHDIVGTGQAEKVHGNLVEVPVFWQSVRGSAPRFHEFIAEGSKMGIGILDFSKPEEQ